MHLGHARTFWIAQERARSQGGTLVLRNEDLDRGRCKPEFVSAMFEDLRWFGFEWQEGPDRGGPFGPYSQSERREFYLAALEKLRAAGFIYPCVCSRQDVLRALQAPHAGEEEPIYPGTCRPNKSDACRVASGEEKPPGTVSSGIPHASRRCEANADHAPRSSPSTIDHRPSSLRTNWRFRVPDGEVISFVDVNLGPQQFVAGKDFGDFVVWRHDDIPAYQLAVVVDDAAMQITEVVRGEDLLVSTARQLLLYRALDLKPPQFYHCPLVTDDSGARLAKRHDALSLRALRANGARPEALRRDWIAAGAAKRL
jgi:glutamyl-tRNA synthetase